MAIMLLIRYVLSSENKRRDQEPPDHTFDEVYIERTTQAGVVEKLKVDKVRAVSFENLKC